MGTIAEKLTYLNGTKTAIKNAIINKGVAVSDTDTFRSYASKIESIQTGGGDDSKNIVKQIIERNVVKLDLSGFSNITKLGGAVFDRYSGDAVSDTDALKEVILPPSVTKIGTQAFACCYNLESVHPINNLTSIGISAFTQCQKLKLNSLPSGITSLARSTFNYCSGLTEMTFEGDMTKLDNFCFYDCPNVLKYVFPNNTSVPSAGADIFYGINSSCVIYVPDSLYDTWITATNWVSYASKIKKISEMPTE